MSIANLKIDNKYELKCKDLAATGELSSGTIQVLTGEITGLATHQLYSPVGYSANIKTLSAAGAGVTDSILAGTFPANTVIVVSYVGNVDTTGYKPITAYLDASAEFFQVRGQPEAEYSYFIVRRDSPA